MSVLPGYLGQGDCDIESGVYTLEDAQTYALELEGCVGFCFEGDDDGEEHEMFFKSEWDYTEADGWSSVRVSGGGEKDPLMDGMEESPDMDVTLEDTDTVTQEPCWLQPVIATTTVYNGIAMQCRPGDGAYDMEMSTGVTERVLGNFGCTVAIQQSFCGICSMGQYCCTHRAEFTHTLKMTTKRVQISMDEAEGCWPSMDVDNPSIGNAVCGCCCLAPSGCIQTKNMGLLDIAGYAREMSVPKVQILSAFRWALSFWALLVIGAFAVAVLQTEEGQAAANVGVVAAQQVGEQVYAAATNTSLASTTPPPPDSSTVPTILMGFALISLLATIIYTLIDRVLVYGWKFVALCVLLVGPVGVFAFWNIDLIFEHLMDPELARTVAPYHCLVDVFIKAGVAAASLPVWLWFAWLYIAMYGVRQYKIKLNFANQVSYTLTMRTEDVNEVSLLLAKHLSGEDDIIEAVDVAGAGLFDGRTDMPINIPGKLLKEIDYAAGGGLKLTNVALATHSEVLGLYFCGAEIYQLTEVYIHSPIIMASLLTKLEYTTNLMPRMIRRLFYLVGFLLLVGGVTLAIRDFTAPTTLPNPLTEVGTIDTGAPIYYLDGTPRMGVALTVFALFIMILPKLTGCCVSQLVLDFTWGTVVLFLTLTSEDAEEVMRWIIQATCRPGEYLQPGDDYGETDLGGEEVFEEAAAQSCISPLRTLQVTTLRIKILDDKTSTSYMRSGLTECDMGPEEWHERCFGLCPCSGWQRPNREANASLSMNFGWLKGLPQDSFPGTNLAMTERMTFSYEHCMQICQLLDQPFGEFVHHMWSPTMYPPDYGA